MLTIEILEHGKVIKTRSFDLTGTTRSAMWNAFFLYWERHFSAQEIFSWRSVN
jgi:hypothetical protein